MQKQEDSNQNQNGFSAGLDEVGYGSCAGPLCIAVIAFPDSFLPIPGVRDSKKVAKKKREELAPLIVQSAAFVGIGWASPQYIDEHGLAAAWQYAAKQALAKFDLTTPLFVDGNREVDNYPGTQVVEPKADDKYWQVSAASIVAKVARDQVMADLEVFYPQYYWGKNSGYGTEDHTEALLKYGPCVYHRRSFLKKLHAKNPRLWTTSTCIPSRLPALP
jgi:ribonuclease HII